MTEEEFDEKMLASILERNPHLVTQLPIHPMRWRALAVWVVMFTFITFWVIRQNRQAIHTLQNNKAAIVQLQSTNCALRGFLSAARQVRLNAAKHDRDPVKKRADLRAAADYAHLSHTFDGHDCRK